MKVALTLLTGAAVGVAASRLIRPLPRVTAPVSPPPAPPSTPSRVAVNVSSAPD